MIRVLLIAVGFIIDCLWFIVCLCWFIVADLLWSSVCVWVLCGGLLWLALYSWYFILVLAVYVLFVGYVSLCSRGFCCRLHDFDLYAWLVDRWFAWAVYILILVCCVVLCAVNSVGIMLVFRFLWIAFMGCAESVRFGFAVKIFVCVLRSRLVFSGCVLSGFVELIVCW